MLEEIKNKTVIITGAARGIGFACAKVFRDAGARVYALDVDRATGEKNAASIGATYKDCDVSDKKSIDAVIAEIVAESGRIDVLINNAAILHKAAFLELEEQDFTRVLNVNLKGAFLMGQAVAKQMVKQVESGVQDGLHSIINMSSVNAVLAIPEIMPYVVSKGGLNQLTKVMALSLAPYGIRVNAIGPGSINTEMLQSVMTNEEARISILSRTPLGRPGEPEEIGKTALFLASDLSSYITGQAIYADGGRLGQNYAAKVKS